MSSKTIVKKKYKKSWCMDMSTNKVKKYWIMDGFLILILKFKQKWIYMKLSKKMLYISIILVYVIYIIYICKVIQYRVTLILKIMKAVEISSYLFYFNDTTTTDQIVDYVNTHIDDFMLNEAHSCSCEKVGDNTILITGDEDYVKENIFVIEPLL